MTPAPRRLRATVLGLCAMFHPALAPQLKADLLLGLPLAAPGTPEIVPGTNKLVIPFKTGRRLAAITGLKLTKVRAAATGGWQSPDLYCYITTNSGSPGGLPAPGWGNDYAFLRYSAPDNLLTEAAVVFDRPFALNPATMPYDLPGGIMLNPDTTYFAIFNFGTDVVAGKNSGFGLARAGEEVAAAQAFTLGTTSELLPGFSLEGIEYFLPGEGPSTPFAEGAGPQVPGVTWAQLGLGTEWTGSGRTASLSVTGISVASNSFGPPRPPAPWRSLEATVVGPGVFSFQWSEPIQARGGRENDSAVCALRVDGALVTPSSPGLRERQQVQLGSGLHRLLWTADYGPPGYHLGGYPTTATFTLWDLSFTPGLSTHEALDGPPGQWTPSPGWTSYFVESAHGQDAVWNKAATPHSFSSAVTGPGTVVFDGIMSVSQLDLQLWRRAFRPVQSTSEGVFELSIDGKPAITLTSGQKHRVPIDDGPHQVSLVAQRGYIEGSMPPGDQNHWRTQIDTLQFIPAHPPTFADWLTFRQLPPTTSPADDPDANGLSHLMEWGTGMVGNQLPVALEILEGGAIVELSSPRNSVAPLDWIIEEHRTGAPWADATSSFAIDLANESMWRARRSVANPAAALYRLKLRLR